MKELTALQHENVVKLYDCKETPTSVSLVMEVSTKIAFQFRISCATKSITLISIRNTERKKNETKLYFCYCWKASRLLNVSSTIFSMWKIKIYTSIYLSWLLPTRIFFFFRCFPLIIHIISSFPLVQSTISIPNCYILFSRIMYL